MPAKIFPHLKVKC